MTEEKVAPSLFEKSPSRPGSPGPRIIVEDNIERRMVLTQTEVRSLYKAKCTDLMIKRSQNQELRFSETIEQKCYNRKVHLQKQGFGLESAKVLAGIV